MFVPLLLLITANGTNALNILHTHTLSDTIITSFTPSAGIYYHEVIAPSSGQLSSTVRDSGGNPIRFVHPSNGACLTAQVFITNSQHSLKSIAAVTSGVGVAVLRSAEIAKLCADNSSD